MPNAPSSATDSPDNLASFSQRHRRRFVALNTSAAVLTGGLPSIPAALMSGRDNEPIGIAFAVVLLWLHVRCLIQDLKQLLPTPTLCPFFQIRFGVLSQQTLPLLSCYGDWLRDSSLMLFISRTASSSVKPSKSFFRSSV